MKLFLFVTFAWSWGIAVAAFAAGWVAFPFVENDKNAYPMVIAFMCGPMIGALVAAAANGDFVNVLRLSFRPNIWWARAFMFPAALVILAHAISLFVPGIEAARPFGAIAPLLTPEQRSQLSALPPLTIDALLLVQAGLVGALINSVLLINEELGWRGFMLSKLSQLGFWPRHLTIGFVWGVWHIPIIAAGHNYPGEPVLGSALFTVYCMLLAPIIGYYAERANSVFGATIFHGTFNAMAAASMLALAGGSVFERGVVGWPGMALLALGCLWLALDKSKDATAPSADRTV